MAINNQIKMAVMSRDFDHRYCKKEDNAINTIVLTSLLCFMLQYKTQKCVSTIFKIKINSCNDNGGFGNISNNVSSQALNY